MLPVAPPATPAAASTSSPPSTAVVPTDYKVSGPPGAIVIEGESAKPYTATTGTLASVPMGHSNEKWSGGAELQWTGFELGSKLTFTVEVPTADTYIMRACLTRGPSQVDVSATIDGKAATYGVVQLDSSALRRTMAVNWGAHTLAAGRHTVEVTAVKAGAGNKGQPYSFGLDYLLLYATKGPATVYPPVFAVLADAPGDPMNSPPTTTSAAAPTGPVVTEFENVSRSLGGGGAVSLATSPRFSEGKAIAWRDLELNHEASWKLPVPAAGEYRIKLAGERSPSSPNLSARINGAGAGEQDHYHDGGIEAYSWDLGIHRLEQGSVTLMLRVDEINRRAARPSSLLLDKITLTPMPGGGRGSSLAGLKPSASPNLRAWTDNQGRTINAAFRGLSQGKVYLELASKQVTPVPLDKLSAESQKLAGELATAAAPPAPAQVSEIIVEGQFEISDLVLGPRGFWIIHRMHDKPTQLLVNGRPWQPTWNENTSSVCDVLAAPLKPVREDRFVEVTRLLGRGTVSVETPPQKLNGETLMVRITDEPNGAGGHRVRLRW